jgi:cytochrome oxidase Cu insertion factor (SCO1/SenC/PrrC family)
MGRRALRGLALALLTAAWTLSVAEDDAFGPLRALRVTPPAPAPSVAFKTLDGKPATLDEFRGRPVLLTFFTTW